MSRLGPILLSLACCASAFGAEVIPPPPAKYFNDYAHVVSSATAQRLNRQLEDFERETSNQILVAVFPKMQSPSSIEDYTDPHLAKIIRTTQRAAKMEPDEKVKFLKAAWDAVGSEFGSRHTQYEMFYAGAKFVTSGHSYRTFDWAGAAGMVDGMMAGYDLAGELAKAGSKAS